MTILYPPRTARSSTRNASMVSAASTPSGNKREEWNWPNLGESTSIAAFLPFFPVQNKPSNHQINSSFTKSGPDPGYQTNDINCHVSLPAQQWKRLKTGEAVICDGCHQILLLRHGSNELDSS